MRDGKRIGKALLDERAEGGDGRGHEVRYRTKTEV
jgi:hypothetical protein